MTDDTFQNDLFGADSTLKRGKKKPLTGKYSKKQLLPYVKVPSEYLVIGSICVLVSMVLVYALGVEKGKKEAFLSDTRTGIVEKELGTEEGPLEGIELSEVSEDVASPEGVTDATRAGESEPAEVKEPVSLESPADKGRYIVQLASFRDKSVAEREADKLRAKGHNIQIEQRSNWHQIQAYGFSDFSEANKAKKEFEKDFSDSFVQKREE